MVEIPVDPEPSTIRAPQVPGEGALPPSHRCAVDLHYEPLGQIVEVDQLFGGSRLERPSRLRPAIDGTPDAGARPLSDLTSDDLKFVVPEAALHEAIVDTLGEEIGPLRLSVQKDMDRLSSRCETRHSSRHVVGESIDEVAHNTSAALAVVGLEDELAWRLPTGVARYPSRWESIVVQAPKVEPARNGRLASGRDLVLELELRNSGLG